MKRTQARTGATGYGCRCCNVMVAMALLFQALLPLIYQPQMPDVETGIPAWIASSLCRGGVASQDASASPAGRGDQQPASPRTPACPICLAAQFAGLLFLPPALAELPLPAEAAATRFCAVPVAPDRAARSFSPQARAPPPTV